jgi:hypothetical protein
MARGRTGVLRRCGQVPWARELLQRKVLLGPVYEPHVLVLSRWRVRLASGMLSGNELHRSGKPLPMKRKFLILLAVAACGRGADSLLPSSDAADEDSTVRAIDSSTEDVEVPTYIFEGKDCGLPDVDQCHSATVWSCCNGVACPGSCARFGDAAPECWCAGFHGGCPQPSVCCGTGQGCIPQKSCSTIGPPPPNCP